MAGTGKPIFSRCRKSAPKLDKFIRAHWLTFRRAANHSRNSWQHLQMLLAKPGVHTGLPLAEPGVHRTSPSQTWCAQVCSKVNLVCTGLLLAKPVLGLVWACPGLVLGLVWACSGLVLGLPWPFSKLGQGLPWACPRLGLGLLRTCSWSEPAREALPGNPSVHMGFSQQSLVSPGLLLAIPGLTKASPSNLWCHQGFS